MSTPIRERLTEQWNRVASYAPFVAFGGGFLFDSVTLGRKVSELDLYLVSAYTLVAMLGVLVRELSLPSWSTRGATLLMQFCLGGAFSALVVLYFKSTGHPLSFYFVTTLFVVMVANEFLHRDEPPHRENVLALWVVAAAMLANFVVPHLVKSVSAVWFYLCVAGAVGVLVALKYAFGFGWRDLRYAFGAAALLVLLWVLGFVPPVPLVYKNNLVCTDFSKPAGYQCMVDEPTLLQRLSITDPTVHTDDAVYCLTAVFAPRDVEVRVEHRWYQRAGSNWKQTDTMTFEMRGGRDDGWRFWSRKRHPAPGQWKVETALADGPVLGYETFDVVAGTAPKRQEKL